MSAGALRGHAGGAAQDIEDTMTFADLHRIKPMVETMPLATCRSPTLIRGGPDQHFTEAAPAAPAHMSSRAVDHLRLGRHGPLFPVASPGGHPLPSGA
jgi:hypothetical protein